MFRFLTVLFTFLTALSFGQFSTPISISSKSVRPTEVILCDLDADGDLDILSNAPASDGVLWLRNDGMTVFSEPIFISEEMDGKSAVFAADLDGDLDLDVISISNIDDKIAWYENDGIGNFGPQNIISTDGDSPEVLEVVDFDLDGDYDIVVGYSSSFGVGWFENTGQGIFLPLVNLLSIDNTKFSLYVADISGDGMLDLVLGSGENFQYGIEWFENIGNDSISGQPSLMTSTVGVQRVTRPLDIDEDGDLDLLAPTYNGQISWYENQGEGSFEANLAIDFGEQLMSYTLIDLDGDEDLDIIGANLSFPQVGNRLWRFENLGDFQFAEGEIIEDSPIHPRLLLAGDLVGDESPDFLSVSEYENKIGLHENEGVGNFSPRIDLLDNIGSPKSFNMVDMDGDGLLDILCATPGADEILWFRQSSDMEFEAKSVLSADQYYSLQANMDDVDQDGDLDIIVVSNTSLKVGWIENIGELEFGEYHLIHESSSLEGGFISSEVHQVVDLDLDGDADILTGNFELGQSSQIISFINEGGQFSDSLVIANLSGGVSLLRALDVDGDGDLDFMSRAGTTGISYVENLGLEGYANPISQEIAESGEDIEDFVPVDTDNDGDKDLFVIFSVENDEYVLHHFENSESNGLVDRGSISLENSTTYGEFFFDAIDVDTDGLPDLVFTEPYADEVAWIKFLGEGNFVPRQLITNEISEPSQFIETDFNADGDPDLIVSSETKGMLYLLENFFQPPLLIAGGTVYADLNQDGSLDQEDQGLDFIAMSSQPITSASFTYDNGQYAFSSEMGSESSYEIFPQIPSNWELTSEAASYVVYSDSSELDQTGLNFGLSPTENFTGLEANLTGGFPRCNQETNYWINLTNEGTSLPSGVIQLNLADNLTYLSSNQEPDSVNGQNLYWSYDSIPFFSTLGILVTVEMPSFTSIGDLLESVLHVDERDMSGAVLSTYSDTLQQYLVCAYDPNDKSVEPLGVGEEGYISIHQELEYLIRFQNTGTDTALTVVVRDALCPELDWSTFEPVAASHEMQVSLTNEGLATFNFENIMLPDSNVDFLGSQGFLKFRILPLDDLSPNTPISNHADIYFDFNPPITTNEIFNTIECYEAPEPSISYSFPNLICEEVGIYYQWYLNGNLIPGANSAVFVPQETGLYSIIAKDENNCETLSEPYSFTLTAVRESQEISARVYPNPFHKHTLFAFGKDPSGEYDLIVYNLQGVEVDRVNRISGTEYLFVSRDLSRGVYLSCLINRSSGRKIFLEKLVVL